MSWDRRSLEVIGVDCQFALRPLRLGNFETMAYVSAKSADDFTSSIGVGTKIDSYNPAYNNVSRLLAQLDYLGIENVRDGTPIAASLSMYITLAKAGIHFNLGESNP